MDDAGLEHLPMRRLSEATRGLTNQYLTSARETLAEMLRDPGLVKPDRLTRKAGSFTRSLLFGDEQMGAWALVWSPGARTPIFVLLCLCCFAVLTGAVRELTFNAISESYAVKTDEVVRRAGYIASMMPSGPNIHQMINDGPQEAISIHIYGYDHRRHSSSVDRTYQQAES